MATSRARNCSISSWVIISDAGAAATASAGAELSQFRFEKGLNQPREKAPPNASFIPSQPLIFSHVGFWFLSRSIPCKKRRVYGRLMLIAGIWAPSTVAHAELPTYSQVDAIPVWVNNEDRHPALLRVSSPNLTAKPSHKIKFMDNLNLADVFWHQLLLICRVSRWLLKSQLFWKHRPLLTCLFESFQGVTK